MPSYGIPLDGAMNCQKVTMDAYSFIHVVMTEFIDKYLNMEYLNL